MKSTPEVALEPVNRRRLNLQTFSQVDHCYPTESQTSCGTVCSTIGNVRKVGRQKVSQWTCDQVEGAIFKNCKISGHRCPSQIVKTQILDFHSRDAGKKGLISQPEDISENLPDIPA